jgi:CheY-like chemotaxis protein
MGDALEDGSSSDEDTRPGVVLVVDDNSQLRRAISRILRACGHEVLQAESGQQALELVEARAVDVVLSDIMMPDMDGLTLLQALRERDADVPVLLMTGSPELSSAVKAVEYGAFEYVMKPFESPKLALSVMRALRHHRVAAARSEVLRSAERVRSDGMGDGEAELGNRRWTGTLLAGRYRVGALIGEGGMGSVYEAVREDLGQMRVAIKVLHPSLAGRDELLQRFRREAEVIGSLDHPNIVKISDFFHAAGGQPPFFVMELLQGVTLASLIESEAPLPHGRVAFIAYQVLGALAAAHSAHVIHRDLKPANVFLTSLSGLRDIVKLLDFGIAKLVSETEPKLTQTGHVVGTPAYMAPEYARGRTIDARSDLYTLGCVMYEALTGREPFTGANYNALLFAIQEGNATPLCEIRSDVPSDFVDVVEKAMAKEPDARFQTAREMEAALERWAIAPSLGPESGSRSTPFATAPTVVSDAPPKTPSGGTKD